ncbi:MAG: hypothetical protein ACOH2M_27075 [Cypionkella sp.]
MMRSIKTYWTAKPWKRPKFWADIASVFLLIAVLFMFTRLEAKPNTDGPACGCALLMGPDGPIEMAKTP